MGGKSMSKILRAIEEMLKPPKVKRKTKAKKFAARVCNLCHTAEDLVGASVTQLVLKLIPDLKQLTSEPIEDICSDCLKRYVEIEFKVTMYDSLRKQTVVVYRDVKAFSQKNLVELLQVVRKLEERLHAKIRIRPSRELRYETRRRLRYRIRELASMDRINRLYEGFERMQKPRKKRKVDLKPSLQDIVDVVKGIKAPRPRVTIGCGDCENAVCPKDCPRYVLAKQLETFLGARNVPVDDYDLSQYYEAEEDELRRLFGD